jgi:acetyltransferase-like isoleucine patch superfamily enzyme
MPIFEPVVILKPEMVQIAETARVDSFVKVEGGQGVVIGEHTHIASFCHINIGGGRVTIGAHVGIASGGKVLGATATPAGLSMSAASPREMQVISYAHTAIGDFVLICTNAVVLPGVTVGEGAVLAAGAVATKDIPAWETWAGVPARKIRARQPHDTTAWGGA